MRMWCNTFNLSASDHHLTRPLLTQSSSVLTVAEAVADINKMVAEGDSENTLQALQSPNAGLRLVLAECADVYQAELEQSQGKRAPQGS